MSTIHEHPNDDPYAVRTNSVWSVALPQQNGHGEISSLDRIVHCFQALLCMTLVWFDYREVNIILLH